MKIIPVKQGSEEWLAERAKVPTASELHEILRADLAPRDGEKPYAYFCRKLAERWLGFPIQTYSGGQMEQGSILESEALPWFEATFKVDVERPGFFTTDDGTFGCSPDGMIAGTNIGIEIKCPAPTKHMQWILAHRCPSDHMLQCQGGMFVTGAQEWRFVSYCRNCPGPGIVYTVKRDEDTMKAIAQAVAQFNKDMESAWQVLLFANKGRPPSRLQQHDSHGF